MYVWAVPQTPFYNLFSKLSSVQPLWFVLVLLDVFQFFGNSLGMYKRSEGKHALSVDNL